jgi:hypothetical protein
MLERDPSQRVTVEGVLDHEWVREGGVADDKHIDLEVMGRIKKFAAMNRLKKEALVVRGGGGLGRRGGGGVGGRAGGKGRLYYCHIASYAIASLP